MDFITSSTTTILGFLFSNPSIFIGYAICVLFPIPWVNSFIISMWAKVGSSVTALVTDVLSGKAAAVVTPVTPAVVTPAPVAPVAPVTTTTTPTA